MPAIPSLVEWYLTLCHDVFAASGRGFSGSEVDDARQLLGDILEQAFLRSSRSKIEIRFEAEPAHPLGFAIKDDLRTITDAYERWIGTSDGPLFGASPDARVTSLADTFADPASSRILDFGAGTGRNALALARRGHPVDAVEITPRFAEMLTQSASAEGLRLRVVADDVFRNRAGLANDYRLIVASEVVPDFRTVADLRNLFELGMATLAEGGLLMFNVHLCALGFTPERAARELAQQCYSCLFTPGEVVQAAAGLPFYLVFNDSVHDFEQAHLPADAWPPTSWYVNWTTGRDVYDVDRADCPVEMRWLVFEKCNKSESHRGLEPGDVAPFDGARGRRFDTKALRNSLEERLLLRTNGSGTLTFPAVPAMVETYATMCTTLFRALGRRLEQDQVAEFNRHLAQMLSEAFAQSQRSNVVLTYESPIGKDLHYTVIADPIPLALAYEQWHHALHESVFGEHTDARLEALVAEVEDPRQCPVLDIGAGLGRNALALARRGFPVDAVELTPRFVDSLTADPNAAKLPLRVVPRDIFDCIAELSHEYRLVLVSGLVGDLRDEGQLRRLFEIAAEVLVPTGHLLLDLHVAADGYVPTQVARQWAQQCCATFFTRDELNRATADLPLVLAAEDPALEYERAHLPTDAWPPTPAFVEWASGQHMAALERNQSPIELRWQLYRKN